MNEVNSQLPQLSPVVTICAAQWSLYVPPSLTFKHSTFCPHTVFVCFVWISEQTVIISLYNINWLVFITDMECVYCAVRTMFLSIIQVYSVHMRFVVDAVTLGQVILFSPVSIIPPLLHAHLYRHVALMRRTNGRSLGTFQKAVLLRKSESLHVFDAWRVR
jgi:hypothetical protein